MPWPSLAWEEKEARGELANTLEVKGIPTLVILGPDNSIITTDGRSEFSEDPNLEVIIIFERTQDPVVGSVDAPRNF